MEVDSIGSGQPLEISEQESHLADISSTGQQARGDRHLAQEGGGRKAKKNAMNVEVSITRLDG